MIVRMRNSADISLVEEVARFLQGQGFDVLVRNGQGDILIAALGIETDAATSFELERKPGVVRIESNDLFIARHSEFKEAWKFFSQAGRVSA